MNDIFSEHDAGSARGPITRPPERRARRGGRVVTDTIEEEWRFKAETDKPGVVFDGSQAEILLAKLGLELPAPDAAAVDDDDAGWVGGDEPAKDEVPATLVADGDAGVLVSGSIFDNLRNDVAQARQKRFETQRGLAKPGQAKDVGAGSARVSLAAKEKGQGAGEAAARRRWAPVAAAVVVVLAGGGAAALAMAGSGAPEKPAAVADRGPSVEAASPAEVAPAEVAAAPEPAKVETPAEVAQPVEPVEPTAAAAEDEEAVTLDELVLTDEDEPAAVPTVSLDELLAAQKAAAAADAERGQNAPAETPHPAAALGHDAPAAEAVAPARAPKAAEPAAKVAAPTPKAAEPAPKAAEPAPKAAEAAPKAAEPAPKAAEAAPKAVVEAPKAAEPAPKAVVEAPKAAEPAPKAAEAAPKAAKTEAAPKAAAEAPKAAEPAPKAAKAEPAPEPAKAAEPAPAKAAGRLSDAALDAYDEARTLHRSDPQRALTLYAEAARRGNVAAWRQIGTLQAQLGDKPAAIAAFKKYRAVAPGARDSQMVADVIRRLGGTPE